jgi:hypothetical protein
MSHVIYWAPQEREAANKHYEGLNHFNTRFVDDVGVAGLSGSNTGHSVSYSILTDGPQDKLLEDVCVGEGIFRSITRQ